MFSEALEYPLNGDSYEPLVIGSVLAILWWLIVPVFVLGGYFLSVIRSAADGETVPPAFEDYGALLIDGLVATLIGIVYTLVPTVVFIAAFTVSGGAGLLIGGDAGMASFVGGILMGLLASSVFYLAVLYVTPAALANYAVTDRIGAAFGPGSLKPILLSGEYTKAWAIAIVIALLGSVISGMISGVFGFIPILGIFIGPLVTVPIAIYIGLSTNYLYGRGVAAALSEA